MKAGFGYDIHRLVRGRKLILGGVEIPFAKGEAGHSDGDVLIHAVIDALLGASGQKDMGTHFPPGDPAWKDISSRLLLQQVTANLRNLGLKPGNLDCTVVLEQPVLKPFIDRIRETLAADLQLEPARISVKAKTAEKLGPVGKNKAVEAYAIVILYACNAVVCPDGI